MICIAHNRRPTPPKVKRVLLDGLDLDYFRVFGVHMIEQFFFNAVISDNMDSKRIPVDGRHRWNHIVWADLVLD